MTGGRRLLLLGASLMTVSCAGREDIKIRAIADPVAKLRSGGDLLGQARMQLALGNAGLALESYRTLLREQPENADVYAGIAACYEAMGRYDLARTNYEFALAYAPTDSRLLLALAGALDSLGQRDQAMQIRTEVAALQTRNPAQPKSDATPMAVPQVATVTVKLPTATTIAKTVDAPAASIRSAAAKVVASKPPSAITVPPAVLEPILALSQPRSQPEPKRIMVQSDEKSSKSRDASAVGAQIVRRDGPYLTRESRGEVALVTTPIAPRQLALAPELTVVPEQPSPAAPPPIRTAALRWIPLNYASAPTGIVLLNAARSQNLAARTRGNLSGRGWHRLAIGDARQVRQHSLVIYAPGRASTAKRLAAQLRCKASPSDVVKSVVVLLGRDAVTMGGQPLRT